MIPIEERAAGTLCTHCRMGDIKEAFIAVRKDRDVTLNGNILVKRRNVIWQISPLWFQPD